MINELFKAIIDEDRAPIVICDTNHIIVYMNPAALKNYERHGGAKLVQKSILDCHNDKSVQAIKTVVKAFEQNDRLDRVFTFHNEKQNKDVYMVALRDKNRKLLGYYEKHEFRNPETCERYKLD